MSDTISDRFRRFSFAAVVAVVALPHLAAAAPPPRANPAPLPAHADARFAPYGKGLFHAGVKVTDVNQGQIGDCYFAAAASSIAQHRPDLIKRAFVHHEDGTLGVHFFERTRDPSSRGAKFTQKTVRIDRTVPLGSDGAPIYASPHNTRHPEQWPSLLEKGFAKLKGGYAGIDGGWPADVMESITGTPSRRITVAPKSADALFDTLRKASQEGRPMAASTFEEKQFPAHVERLKSETPDSPALATLKRLKGSPYGFDTGVFPDHSYTVLGVSEKDGQKSVILRNPLGFGEPGPGGWGTRYVEGDGIFALPLSTFVALYKRVDLAGVTAKTSP